jgi:hypothetical protein
LLSVPSGALEKSVPTRRFLPTVDSYTDGMPGAESPGEGPPFAAVFTDIDYGIRETAVIDFHVPPLFGKKVHNFFRCSRVNFMA